MPLLSLRCYPRMNLYLGVEQSAALIIDAPLSYTVGQPFCSSEDYISATSANSSSLHFSIIKADTGEVLVSDAEVALNSTSNVFEFPLSSFKASFNPYEILIKSISAPCNNDIQIVTQLSVREVSLESPPLFVSVLAVHSAEKSSAPICSRRNIELN